MLVSNFSAIPDVKNLRDQGKFNSQNVLTVDSNPKLTKSPKGELIVYTAGHHFTPVMYGACASASKECAQCCLHTSGNPIAMPAKEIRRRIRSESFFKSSRSYMRLLVIEICRFIYKKSNKGIYNPLERFSIRLNATSDYYFERVPVDIDSVLCEFIKGKFGFTLKPSKYNNIMEVFKASPLKILSDNVVFYDYTKHNNRLLDVCKSVNYDITVSYGSKHENIIDYAIENTLNVAAPVDVKKGQPLPKYIKIKGYDQVFPCIDGDLHDARWMDLKDQTYFVLLRYKNAENDTPEMKAKFCLSYETVEV